MSSCAAKTRAGAPCKQPAGARTDHPGKGRCWLHGGATPIRNPAAVRTTELARYRVANNAALGELIERFELDPDPLNVLTEVAVLRAVLQQTLERMQVLACPMCKRPPDEDRVPVLIEGVSRVVGRIEKARAARSVSEAELVSLLQRLALVVKHHVRDRDTLESIARGWDELVVSITASRGGNA